jgi:hypothetical protein
MTRVASLVCGLFLAAGATTAQEAPPSKTATSVESVVPLLKQRCAGCHGDDNKKVRAGLDLRTRAAALRGGDSGEPALVPGDPARSGIYRALTSTDPQRVMPPKESERLTAAEVELVRQWIVAGAPWPTNVAKSWDEAGADGIVVGTSGGRSPEWTQRKYRPEDLWAYRPVRNVVPPTSPAAHPVDALLRAALARKGIKEAAAAADRRTLLRRATYDLTGLPPTTAEMDTFLADARPDAFASAIDRLLSGPHYGEQMARHWLDVVRYADTSGFANDYERPAAWRYRDYVVRSFNADKPYDRFILEQIAGDELDPLDPEMLIAVGFLRMGPWEQTGMSVAALTRQMFLDDVTHSVGVTFLGHGLRCASCHDHKFDPVPTRDYYRLQAVFAPTQFAERPVAFLPSENTASFAGAKAVVERRLAQVTAERDKLRQKNEEAIAAYLKQRGVKRLADLPDGERPRKDDFGLNTSEKNLARIYQKRIEYFNRELTRYEPYAHSVYDGPPNSYTSQKPINQVPAQKAGAIPVVHILSGGALDAPADPVTPGVLSAMAAFAPRAAAALPESAEGRRLALARWIASPDNSLTARVIVNRVWQWHFGTGLVATPNNFGKMGKRPSNPELLDFLAQWFVEHGWSIKELHRLIMTSAAYQQAGAHPELDKLQKLDPKNELLAYFPPRRLAAEEIRDSMLSITGELNREAGGPGTFPEMNWEVALQPRHTMGTVAPAYQPSPRPDQRHRRTLYAFRYRNLADPLQEVFNRPGTETSCERRDETIVAPQAFALFNSSFTHDRALALAARLTKQAANPTAQIPLAFRAVLGRDPSPDDLRDALAHVAAMTAHHRAHSPTRTELPTRVTRRMVEEFTGEEHEWQEELDAMRDYQRDLQPWQVSPETRALADVCLVLFNSNEFLSIR